MSNTNFLSQLPLDYILKALTPEEIEKVQQQVVTYQRTQQELLAKEEEQRKNKTFTRIIQESTTPLGIFSRCKDEGQEFLQWALYERSFENFIAAIQQVKGLLNSSQEQFLQVVTPIDSTVQEPTPEKTPTEEPLYIRVLSILKSNSKKSFTASNIISTLHIKKDRKVANVLDQLVKDGLAERTDKAGKYYRSLI